MNMFIHEFKYYRKSTIIWTLAMVALAGLFLSLYPALSKDIVDFKKILMNYPEGIRDALGISVDSFSTMIGFYSFVFGYIILCGAIQAMNLGTSIISKEVREKTADFLLTKPVKRSQIMTAKLLGILANLVLTNVIYILVSVIIASNINSTGMSLKIFFMISITLFFVQLLFISLGIIISVIFPKIKSVISVSLCTVFSFFIFSMLGSIIGEKAVRYITPFKFYDSAYIIKNGSYEAPFVIIEILFIIVAIVASFIIYSKKDIHAV